MTGTVGDPDYIPMGLLYNMVIRPRRPSQEEIDTQTVPLEECEEVILGIRYKERGGYITTLTKAIDPATQEYFLGYRFVGDNYVYYGRYGETQVGSNLPGSNDLVGKVV